MKRYALKRAGEVERTVDADNIDQALDLLFPTTLVDVDLDTATPTSLTVRPLHARKSLPTYVIEEDCGG